MKLTGSLMRCIFSVNNIFTIQSVPGGKVSILRSYSIGHSKQNLYMYMCRIQNSFRDRVISQYSSKIVDKKELLATVSNCSSDKVGTVYLVQYIFKITPPASMHFPTRVRTWRVARLSES
jgi:hypothetical protein